MELSNPLPNHLNVQLIFSRLLRQRLQQRGRESTAEIEMRLARAKQYQPPELNALTVVDNNGTIEQAGAKLVALLQA